MEVNEGLLIASYGRLTGTVCDDEFTPTSATAICRYMGYTTYDYLKLETNWSKDLGYPIVLDNVNCSTDVFSDCTYITGEITSCKHYEDVQLGCTCDNKSIRTPNGRGCVPCPGNSTSNSQRTRCLCDVGYEMVEQKCTLCDAGYFKPFYSSQCLPCPHPAYSDPGSSTCLCPSGFVFLNERCERCASNAISIPGDSECTHCPDTIDADPSRSRCICNAGWYWNETVRDCKVCQDNYYSRKGDTMCTKCPIHTVSYKGSHTCDACESGFYWSDHQCFECPEGYYGDGIECVQCGMGFVIGESGFCESTSTRHPDEVEIIVGSVVFSLVLISLMITFILRKRFTSFIKKCWSKKSKKLITNIEYHHMDNFHPITKNVETTQPDLVAVSARECEEVKNISENDITEDFVNQKTISRDNEKRNSFLQKDVFMNKNVVHSYYQTDD